MKKLVLLITLPYLFINCSSTDCCYDIPENLYFPPVDNSNTWETISPPDLSWNVSEIANLKDYLEQKNTKSFIILYNGKIVMEEYFNGHNMNDGWYWASSGKTLTATVTGIAQQEGLLNINNKVSDYLGTGWTSALLEKENLITCKNLLTMTSGLDDTFNDANDDCVNPNCLVYSADAGTKWAYDNVYVKLQDVVDAVTPNYTWETYFNEKLRDKIGMTGSWFYSGNASVYWSNTRSMARFGLLALNQGNWNGNIIVNQAYFNQATNTSQNINLSYGYLWWLNGKLSYKLPDVNFTFTGSIIPSAPDDMFCALGKNDQKIYVSPSRRLVVVRMGNAADNENFALSDFDEVLWQKINAVIN